MTKTRHRTGVKPLPLRQAFKDLSHCPALAFERAAGFRGLGRRYRIPRGRTALQYEDLYTWVFNADAGVRHQPDIFKGSGFPEAGREIPGRMNDFLQTVSPRFTAALRRGWENLVALNPPLRAVKVKEQSAREYYNAILGATSGFNADDIAYFLHHLRRNGRPASMARAEHGDRLEKAEAACGRRLYWVLSPATLNKVETRLRRRGLLNP